MIEPDLPPAPPPPPEHDRPRRRALAAVLLILILLVGTVAGYTAWALGGSSSGTPVTVIIPGGASGADIARLLEEAGVVRSAFVFRVVARLRGVARDLKPGAYRMRAGLGVSGAIAVLRKGVPLKVERFTIPEGMTVVETARIVGRHTHISRAAFLRAARSGRHRLPIMPRGTRSLEGLLFPKTYEIAEGTTADEVVEMLLDQFRKETASLDFSRARALGLSPYEAVIVASLIEKEARLPKEQALIASVIHNRLRKPLRLNIDATIQYVYIQQTGRPKNPLEFSDYGLDSPYNTYRIDGLPPTPIAAPGAGALRASLRPARTSYFYYRLCDPDRLALGHVFGRTLEERDATWRRRCA